MTPNPRHWARELWQRSRDRGLQTHIDVLVDATGLDDYPLLVEHARQSDPPALFKLLEQTPEAALADEGPLLLRLEDGHAAWLDELLERIDCRHHLMLLFSPWPLPRLGEHLRSCTQAEWNQGRSSGVLRFYEPGLFMAVSDMLDPGRAATCMPRFPAGTGWTATAGRGSWPVITRPTRRRRCKRSSAWKRIRSLPCAPGARPKPTAANTSCCPASMAWAARKACSSIWSRRTWPPTARACGTSTSATPSSPSGCANRLPAPASPRERVAHERARHRPSRPASGDPAGRGLPERAGHAGGAGDGLQPYVRGDQWVFGEWGGWTTFRPLSGGW